MQPSGLHHEHRMRRPSRLRRVARVLVAACILFAALEGEPSLKKAPAVAAPIAEVRASALTATGIHKIKHIVIIMQENRSFDSYFGTFPGADGIPMRNGVPTVCNPSAERHRCIRPYVDNAERNAGGPHGLPGAMADIDSRKMDGFVATAERGGRPGAGLDVMGYHTARSIPNYWAYAHNFVLNDHMFASQLSWSLPEHLYLVSGWAAGCSQRGKPASCADSKELDGPSDFAPSTNVVTECGAGTMTDTCRTLLSKLGVLRVFYLHSLISTRCALSRSYRAYNDSYNSLSFSRCTAAIRNARLRPGLERSLVAAAAALRPPDYAWTDLTYLLHEHGVSWRYYVMTGTEPDCRNDGAVTCPTHQQNWRTPGIWNPLPYFDTVHKDRQLTNVTSLTAFYRAARRGSLPAVSWISPSGQVSEHPPNLVGPGQAYVTGLINTIMRGPDWKSTAIFLSWDDWGGFYDHVPPPTLAVGRYGLRVPGLVISAYAKHGYVDHQLLSHDAYIKFIEDDFLGGARLDPTTDGRPDPRHSVRENAPRLGNLVRDFNFAQRPRRPLILSGQTIY